MPYGDVDVGMSEVDKVIHVVTCFFQAEDGRRDLARSRGHGYVYKREEWIRVSAPKPRAKAREPQSWTSSSLHGWSWICLLYTCDADVE